MITPATLKQNWTLWGLIILALLVFVEMAALSAAQYLAYNNTSTDISSMSQAIWSATQWKPLIFTIEGAPLSRLGRHVEVIYFLFAPLYALFPSPLALLVAQAALFVSGAFPLYRLAKRRLQSPAAALMLGAIYLFYPVAQTAVLFDFHGDTLAMPLLLWMIEAAGRRSWRSYFIWMALALSCKVYVALPAAAFGVWLWLRGKRRIGGISVLAALLWGGIAFFVIRPLFTPEQVELVLDTTPPSYLDYYFGDWSALRTSILPRLLTAILIYLPALILGWRALDWLVLASVIAVPVLLSTEIGPGYYYGYHHYALGVPFFVLAIFYGAQAYRNKKERGDRWKFYLGASLLLTLIFNGLLVDTPLNINFYTAPPGSGQGIDSSKYGISARDEIKTRWLAANVPAEVALSANTAFLPHLLNRHRIYVLGKLTLDQTTTADELLTKSDYVVADALFDYVKGAEGDIRFGGLLYDMDNIAALLHRPDFGLKTARDGLLLFSRGEDGLLQKAEVSGAVDEKIGQRDFDGIIKLLDVQITPQGKTAADETLYQAQIDWMATQDLSTHPPYIAVSRVEGLEYARIVHLPTIGLVPTTTWQPYRRIRETFQFVLPANTPPGAYPLWTGWYRTDSIFSADTDARSRVGGEILLETVIVP